MVIKTMPYDFGRSVWLERQCQILLGLIYGFQEMCHMILLKVYSWNRPWHIVLAKPAVVS